MDKDINHVREITSIEMIDLDSILDNERVVTRVVEEEDNIPQTIIEVQRYNAGTKNWYTVYTWKITGRVESEIETGYWCFAGANVLILKIWQGSGGFLSYRVLSYRLGCLQELLVRDGIFQGNVFLECFKLIEQTGNQYRLWVMIGWQLRLIPYRVPIIPGAYLVKYQIQPDNRILINRDKFIIPVGGILQFLRLDFNNITERVLYSSDKPDGIQAIPRRSAYYFKEPMKAAYTIIPEGYDWNNSRNITVNIIGVNVNYN